MPVIYYSVGTKLVQWIELCLALGVAITILIWSGMGSGPSGLGNFFARLETRLRQFSRRKTLVVITVGFSVLVLRAALIPLFGIPQPWAHDEFSYLLAADTFSHGRITNPPHPMWIHFETFHVIQNPTYMSMYPPAQGLVLALGQRLGHPWLGEWLITGAMCAALTWLLQGWFPPDWALLGGFLIALRFCPFSYWMDGYWSTSVVAFGGALVIGALPRLQRHLRVRDACWMALGLVILASSRPYEGLILAITVAVALLAWLASRKLQFTVVLRRLVAPALGILLFAGLATTYYNRRVTGNALKLAYQVNRQIYSRSQYFVWQRPRAAIAYDHPAMQIFYDDEFEMYRWTRHLGGFIRTRLKRGAMLWKFYLGPTLTLAFLGFPYVLRDRRMKFPLWAMEICLLAIAVEVFISPHYLAPALGLLWILLMQSLRHLAKWRWRDRSPGIELVRAIPVICCTMLLLRIGAAAASIPLEAPWPRGDLQRAAIERRLEDTPGQHLVLVRYGPHHSRNKEWVYNRADIDHAKVVWARDMGDDKNQELIRYFSQRDVWLVIEDQGVAPLLQKLTPPPAGTSLSLVVRSAGPTAAQ